MLYVIATCKPLLLLFFYFFIIIIIFYLKIYQNIGQKLGSNNEHQYNFDSSTNMSLRVQQDHNPSIFIFPFHILYKFINP
jgi:hypothetical protein